MDELIEIVNVSHLNKGIKVIYMRGKFSGTITRKDHGMAFVISAYFKDEEGEQFIGFPSLDQVEFPFEEAIGNLTIFGKG